jgi:Mg-chelatase subunit ChlD
MLRDRFRRRVHDGSHGWIAMTDLFTLVALAMIGVAVSQGNWIRINFPKTQEPPKSTTPDTTEIGESIDDLKHRLREMEIERNKLKEEVAQLNAQLQTLQDKIVDGVGGRQVLDDELANLKARNNELIAEIARKQADLDAAKARITRLESDLATINRELEAERARLAQSRKAELALQAEVKQLRARLDGQRVPQQILGLEGSLGRVVFVLDRSSSMGKEKLWEKSIATIMTWLQYFPVREVALVTFGSDIDEYPGAGQFLPQKDGLDTLAQTLKSLQPIGETRTMEALQRAYALQGVDAIVLFTDGMPTSSSAKDVREFVRERHAAGNKLRIHTVGVGDYFNREMGDFLQGLAKDTGGTFIGR